MTPKGIGPAEELSNIRLELTSLADQRLTGPLCQEDMARWDILCRHETVLLGRLAETQNVSIAHE